ncbi:uncharacterized protein LOC119629880 [Bombyx mori]|uniref:Uncharacterized protein n=1 Tax=Bombyx mori TaxID=7091 RepID=A0A8R2R776_BOMMO|nr:uncharacterized protein LOC119629880 [Bombyx mori]
MSGGTSPPIISTPGPSRKGRQAMAGIFAHRSQPTGPEMDSGKDDRPRPSVAAQGTPRIRPEETSSPPLTDRSGPPRPRKKVRSESDRSISEAQDKRPRIGPSSKSINEAEEDEDSEETSYETTDSEYESDVTHSSRSSSSSSKESPPTRKPIPRPRMCVETAVAAAAKQLRTPPRSPSPPISPIPTIPRRGAPITSCTVGNLESTRYMDLEHSKPTTGAPESPTPSTSYAAMAAKQFAPTKNTQCNPPAPGKSGNSVVPRRHPPIMVEALPNWSRHMAALRERLGRAPSVRPYGTGFRFLPASGEEYRVVQAYLVGVSSTDNAIKWYCYALEEEIPARVAIRGLPADTDPTEIVNSLKELGFPARYARCIRAKRGRPGCVFYLRDGVRAEDLRSVIAARPSDTPPATATERSAAYDVREGTDDGGHYSSPRTASDACRSSPYPRSTYRSTPISEGQGQGKDIPSPYSPSG